MTKLTPTMLKTLRRAAKRATGFICPTPGLNAAAQQRVIDALDRRGLLDYPTREYGAGWGPPFITDAGRAVVAEEDG